MTRTNRNRLLTVGLAMLAFLALAPFADSAGTVYVTPNGKTYHTTRTCSVLARSKAVLVTNEETAEKHGLKLCATCNRGKSTKAKGNSWATPEMVKGNGSGN